MLRSSDGIKENKSYSPIILKKAPINLSEEDQKIFLQAYGENLSEFLNILDSNYLVHIKRTLSTLEVEGSISPEASIMEEEPNVLSPKMIYSINYNYDVLARKIAFFMKALRCPSEKFSLQIIEKNIVKIFQLLDYQVKTRENGDLNVYKSFLVRLDLVIKHIYPPEEKLESTLPYATEETRQDALKKFKLLQQFVTDPIQALVKAESNLFGYEMYDFFSYNAHSPFNNDKFHQKASETLPKLITQFSRADYKSEVNRMIERFSKERCSPITLEAMKKILIACIDELRPKDLSAEINGLGGKLKENLLPGHCVEQAPSEPAPTGNSEVIVVTMPPLSAVPGPEGMGNELTSEAPKPEGEAKKVSPPTQHQPGDNEISLSAEIGGPVEKPKENKMHAPEGNNQENAVRFFKAKQEPHPSIKVPSQRIKEPAEPESPIYSEHNLCRIL